MAYLERITKKDIPKIFHIQKEGFEKLYTKYQDKHSPYNETNETLLKKFDCRNNYMFLIKIKQNCIGYIRVVTNDTNDQARIAPIVILPQYENLGLGTSIIQLIESEFDTVIEWHLGTILQEKKLVHFYTKLGYEQQVTTEPIQEGMDEVFFTKVKKK